LKKKSSGCGSTYSYCGKLKLIKRSYKIYRKEKEKEKEKEKTSLLYVSSCGGMYGIPVRSIPVPGLVHGIPGRNYVLLYQVGS
jgi:hypothetical protein